MRKLERIGIKSKPEVRVQNLVANEIDGV